MKKIEVIDIDFSGYSKGDKTVLYETADECVNAGLNVTSDDLEMLEEKVVDGLVEIKNSDDIIQVYNNKASNPDKYMILYGGEDSVKENCAVEPITVKAKRMPYSIPISQTFNHALDAVVYFNEALSSVSGIAPKYAIVDEYNAAKEAEKQALYYEQAYADAELELSEIETTIEYNERYLEQLRSRANEIKYFLYGTEEV